MTKWRNLEPGELENLTFIRRTKIPNSSKHHINKSLNKDEYTPSESQIAIAFVDYVAKTHPDLLQDLIKIDNENKCSWAEGKKKKREGKVKGYSDYFLAHPVRLILQDDKGDSHLQVFHGFWHELKTKKGKESPEQKEFGERMRKKGYEYKCSHSIDEAIENLELYLKGFV